MLFIDLWKKVVIWVVVALGLVLALPNAFYDRVEQFNDAEKAIEVGFDTPENREKTGLWPSFLPSSLVNLGWICAVVRICWPRCKWPMFMHSG